MDVFVAEDCVLHPLDAAEISTLHRTVGCHQAKTGIVTSHRAASKSLTAETLAQSAQDRFSLRDPPFHLWKQCPTSTPPALGGSTPPPTARIPSTYGMITKLEKPPSRSPASNVAIAASMSSSPYAW